VAGVGKWPEKKRRGIIEKAGLAAQGFAVHECDPAGVTGQAARKATSLLFARLPKTTITNCMYECRRVIRMQ